MDSKVISTRVSIELFDRVNEVADRLYPKSYNGLPNRTQLLMDALRLFCDLGEAGSLDGMNLSQIDTSDIVYSVNNPKEDAIVLLRSKLENIESKLDLLTNKEEISKNVATKSHVLDSSISAVYSVNEQYEETNSSENSVVYSVNKRDKKALNLQEAYELAKSRGYSGTKKSFSNSFTKNKHESYQNFGISRTVIEAGKPGLYFDNGTSSEK